MKTPSNWTALTLGDLLNRPRPGKSLNCEDRVPGDGEVGILKTSSITSGVFVPGESKVPVKGERDSVRTPVRENTILICRKNTPSMVGASAYVSRSYENLFLPDLIWELTARDPSNVDMRWLAHVFLHKAYKARISSIASGTSQSMVNIGQDEFLALPILTPPLAEQRKLAEILVCWDRSLSFLDRLHAQYQLQKLGMIKNLLREKKLCATDYVPFGDVVESSQYGLNSQASPTGTVPMLRMGNLDGGKVLTDDLVMAELSQSDRETYLLRKGDVLFNRTNSYELVGKTSVFALDGDFTFASYIIRFRLDTNKATPGFVAQWFNLPESQKKLKRLATKGVSQSNINPTILRNRFLIPKLSKEEQARISEMLSCWDRAIECSRKLRLHLVAQRDGLMQQLLTGHVRVRC